MHHLIAFAHGSAPACDAVLRELQLPHLERLLAHLSAQAADSGDEYTLSPPHERALAAALGWQCADGAAPWAAAAQARLDPASRDRAWAWITPCHWDVGMDHITMGDPQDLRLPDADSRALMQAMQAYFSEDGITLHYDSAHRWLASSPVFDGLACASLDRVIGRNIDAWVPASAQAAPLRRLQNEMQMLLYQHPVNDRRAEQGLPSVNSFWFSACGRLPADLAADAPAPELDTSLRAPALREDWQAWGLAWQALDAGLCARLLDAAQSGAALSLTLCGERSARRFDNTPRNMLARLRQRWSHPSARATLESL